MKAKAIAILLSLSPLLSLVTSAATNLVSNTAIVTNRVQSIVTYTISNGVARVQDPSGKLIGTAEERALKVAAEGQVDIASAAADAAGTAMEEWREFTATTDVKVVYIDAGFTQDLPALAPNLCGWVAGSFYDREKGEDHYYVWFNREIDAPPSMCARIVSERGTNWLDAAWKDWAVTNWVQDGRVVEWSGAGKYSAEVEYLESHGTERIDTGIMRDVINTHRIVIDFLYFNTSERQLNGVQGYVYVGVVSGYFQIGNFGLEHMPEVAQSNTRYLIDALFDNGNRIVEYSVNRTVVRRVRWSGENTPREANFHLFSLNDIALPSSCKIFSSELYRNEILVRDFLPVLDLAGRPAMYDRVSGRLFYNSGTGEFAYGPVTAAPVPCRELVVPRRNANCVLKTGTVITLGGKDGFDADIHKVNIEIGGTPAVTTSAQLPLFYAVTRSGTNTVTRAFTNGFVNVENGFVKEPSNE